MIPIQPKGTGEELPTRAEVADVVETLCRTSKEGVLEVQSGSGAGQIVFRAGRVLHAQVADLKGEAAFSQMVATAAADFRVVPLAAVNPPTITRPWEELLIETVRNQRPEGEKDSAGKERKFDAESLFRMIRRMSLIEKVRFALRCGKEGRTLLIRENSRAVQLAVLSNARITDGEVALIAGSKTVDEEILRRIAEQREWTKYYPVRLALAVNPKTATAIAVKMLPTLMPQDVSQIAKSKDVPAQVALAARRLMLQKG